MGLAKNVHRQLCYAVYLIIEIVKIFWNEYVNISHDFQHIETLQQVHISLQSHTIYYGTRLLISCQVKSKSTWLPI